MVEIVDENGRPSAPGSTGAIVVTDLKNAAMPLLRYDTDDTAEAVAGPGAHMWTRGPAVFRRLEDPRNYSGAAWVMLAAKFGARDV